MSSAWYRTISILACLLLVLSISSTYIGCNGGGGGGGGGDDDDDTTRVEANVSSYIDDVDLEAGETTEFTFTYPRLPGAKPYTDVTVNCTETLNAVDVSASLVSGSIQTAEDGSLVAIQEATTAEMYFKIADADDVATVCDTGYAYGPFTITLTEDNAPESVDPPTATADQQTVSIINTGSYAICLLINSPVAATLDVEKLVMDVKPCEDGYENFDGFWSGTYECTAVGDDPSCTPTSGPETIELRITQDEYSARYTDFEANYRGTVCGDTFSFNGGVTDAYDENAGYDESGTFTMTGENTATKTSSYEYKNGQCSGTCTDTLTWQYE